MAFWDAIVLIVLISAIAGIINGRMRHRRPVEGQPGAGAVQAQAQAQAQDEIRQLKERIQVLERVVTDNHGSHRLGDEIERLRDR